MTPISARTSTVAERIAPADCYATLEADFLLDEELLPAEPFTEESPPPEDSFEDDAPDGESPDAFAAASEPFACLAVAAGSFAAERLSVR